MYIALLDTIKTNIFRSMSDYIKVKIKFTVIQANSFSVLYNGLLAELPTILDT